MGRAVIGLGCVCLQGQCLEMGKDFLPFRCDGTRFSLLELFTDIYLALGYFLLCLAKKKVT